MKRRQYDICLLLAALLKSWRVSGLGKAVVAPRDRKTSTQGWSEKIKLIEKEIRDDPDKKWK